MGGQHRRHDSVEYRGLTRRGGTGIFTAITSAVVFDYCFIPPAFSFAATDLPYLVTLIGFVAAAIATSEPASRTWQLTNELTVHSTPIDIR